MDAGLAALLGAGIGALAVIGTTITASQRQREESIRSARRDAYLEILEMCHVLLAWAHATNPMIGHVGAPPAVLLAVGCGDDELPTAGSELPTTILSTVQTTTTSDTTPESPPSIQSSTARSDSETTLSGTTATTMLTSSSQDVAADPVADVLAAAAAYWLPRHPPFTTLHVVERLGQANDEFVRYSDNSPQMTSQQRGAIEAALTPLLLTWTHDLESVAGPQ